MQLVRIPDEHSVVRHCKKRLLARDASGNIAGVFPELFEMRLAVAPENKPEKYLSAFYFEYFSGTDQQRMAGCKAALPFVPKKGDALVRLSAGEMREQGKSNSRPIRVEHEKSHAKIPSKAQIIGIPLDPNRRLNSDLANKAVIAILPV